MRLSLPLAASLVPTAALISVSVLAATITVNSTADNITAGDGQCTLREALANVNASADTTGGDCTAGTGSGDTITFAVSVPATIKLTSGQQLDIAQNVAITGPTTGSLTVSGSKTTRVFANTAGAVTISDLIVLDGIANDDDDGGGIHNFPSGTMTVTNCTFSGNKAAHGSSGGGIFNEGTMTLSNCTFSRNRTEMRPVALGSDVGGGILNESTMTLTNCTFSHNSAVFGGAIANAGTMTLANSTLSRNRTLAHNGGGILNDNSDSTMTLSNCTLVGNAGCGINLYAGTMTLTNCTLSKNHARRHFAEGIIMGPFVGTVTLLNTIVANSCSGSSEGTSITSNGHNLGSDATCFAGGGTDLVNTDPMLAPLADYGGPTNTMASRNGSPAIDAGDDAVLGPPYNLTTDQRGLQRDAGAHVDIGAYEAQ